MPDLFMEGKGRMNKDETQSQIALPGETLIHFFPFVDFQHYFASV